MYGDQVDIEFDDVVHETEKAYLISVDGNEIWIPKSQIIEMDDSTMTIPEWLAEENDLI